MRDKEGIIRKEWLKLIKRRKIVGSFGGMELKIVSGKIIEKCKSKKIEIG